MRVKTMVLMAVLAGSATVAVPAEMKKMDDPAAKLKTLVGTWRGTATMTETGKAPVKLDVRIDCREVSGGSAVSCEDAMTGKGMDYRETDLFGYDADSGKVHWYAVTNAGEVHDHVGNWNDWTLAVRHAGPAGEKQFIEDVTLRFDGKGAMDIDTVGAMGGSQVSTFKGSAKKVK